MNAHIDLPPLSEEFVGAELGDKRRARRLGILLDSAMKSPAAGLPVQAGSDGALEGTYRFLSNENIEPAIVLEAHLSRTAERAEQLGCVVVVHDTTQFQFGGEAKRVGLGPLRGKGQGFFAHYSMAFGLDGRPLGVAALRAWTRGLERRGKRSPSELQADEDRESLRWHEAAAEAAERFAGRATAIHVMDREADSYELFADLREDGQRFVIRLAHDRNLELRRGERSEAPKLYSALATGNLALEREVHLSRRAKSPNGPKADRIHPPRQSRKAHLLVRARTLVIARGRHQPAHLPDGLELNFVEVYEPDPPEGQPAVCWRLVTTEPIETAEDVARVVDLYRLRWQIEEYFKALKTGCAFQKLQLESAKTLLMALIIFSAVAWRLLLLRWMERNEAERPATLVLTPTQLAVLAAVRRKAGKPLPDNPTCRQVLLAIAALGGHIRNNGPPGWQVLGRGFDKLLVLEEGWLAATVTSGGGGEGYRENFDR